MSSTYQKFAASLREQEGPSGSLPTNGPSTTTPFANATNRYLNNHSGPNDFAMAAPATEEKFAGVPRTGTMPERRLSISSNYSRASEMVFGKDALLGPRRPRPHKIWKKKYIKLIVVGDSGLGKTTLIKSLISIPGERLQVHDGSYTPTEQFRRDPESLSSTVSWRDEEDRVIWVYKIQDTPGYGDELDVFRNLKMVQDYIESQNRKWLELEQARDRKEDLAEIEDPRVDLCIFCIPPHRLRPIDLKYMFELGKHVPVVPVVTKADTMTIREANTYRTEVANRIANPMVPGIHDKINIFKFERDTLERAGVQDHATPHPPFLVIASNDISEELAAAEPPLFWPERRYPWGTAEAFNKEHSDLLAVRALLMKEALEEISKTKRARYEAWRRTTLGGLKLGRRITGALMWTIIPAIVCLQVGRAGVRMEDVRRFIGNNVDRIKRRLPKKAEAKPAPAPVEEPKPAPAPAPAPPPPAPAKKGWGF
ncbi:hypothetical protein CHLRE_12g556250v5 [Chlamydomonas reinhardtii]|uniref:Uncharacterized protein n=1 Tax=Chlamydomonas reinhardtii TaxID=3055 RepID=A8IYS5_CHLRE|nr:uncharacterized protein CHLRE_12g556250v5 [Chlamydomonas reinhardtii]PNW75891.1 hypothetical protein CHLRE_12g556250v5 [Chlamydomonas reinhardtii]|eukprot:XP_001694177.1 septin-like protein [Chlamydomonas reinhardtii]